MLLASQRKRALLSLASAVNVYTFSDIRAFVLELVVVVLCVKFWSLFRLVLAHNVPVGHAHLDAVLVPDQLGGRIAAATAAGQLDGLAATQRFAVREALDVRCAGRICGTEREMSVRPVPSRILKRLQLWTACRFAAWRLVGAHGWVVSELITGLHIQIRSSRDERAGKCTDVTSLSSLSF